MSNPQTIPEAKDKIIKVFEALCKNLNLDHTIKVEDEYLEGEKDGQYILLSVDEGLFNICIQFEEVVTDETIFGRTKGTRIHYILQHEIYNPGVRYYPDGSGEPPSSDIVDVAAYPTPYHVISEGLVLAFKNDINSWIEGMALEEEEAEAEKGWNEYCDELAKDMEVENNSKTEREEQIEEDLARWRGHPQDNNDYVDAYIEYNGWFV